MTGFRVLAMKIKILLNTELDSDFKTVNGGYNLKRFDSRVREWGE